MGTWIGHVDEAVFFILIALWWIFHIFPGYINVRYLFFRFLKPWSSKDNERILKYYRKWIQNYRIRLILTRMHSSRMRTGRSLTVCCSLLPGGCLLWGGAWSGGCLLWGVSALGGAWLGGVCSGVCLLWGVCSRGVPGPGGVCSWGLLQGDAWSGGGGGVCSRGGASQHALRQTPLPLPPCGQTHACKNITLAQLRCGR